MNEKHPSRQEDLLAKLKSQGYRLTPQRMELIRLIASSEGHPSATQIYEKIKSRFPTMSQATVYKTLNMLKEMGQILEIDLHGDSHYDGNKPHPHPHLVCTQCNQIIDAELSLDPLAISQLEKTSGYHITQSQIIFYGICPKCKALS